MFSITAKSASAAKVSNRDILLSSRIPRAVRKAAVHDNKTALRNGNQDSNTHRLVSISERSRRQLLHKNSKCMVAIVPPSPVKRQVSSLSLSVRRVPGSSPIFVGGFESALPRATPALRQVVRKASAKSSPAFFNPQSRRELQRLPALQSTPFPKVRGLHRAESPAEDLERLGHGWFGIWQDVWTEYEGVPWGAGVVGNKVVTGESAGDDEVEVDVDQCLPNDSADEAFCLDEEEEDSDVVGEASVDLAELMVGDKDVETLVDLSLGALVGAEQDGTVIIYDSIDEDGECEAVSEPVRLQHCAREDKEVAHATSKTASHPLGVAGVAQEADFGVGAAVVLSSPSSAECSDGIVAGLSSKIDSNGVGATAARSLLLAPVSMSSECVSSNADCRGATVSGEDEVKEQIKRGVLEAAAQGQQRRRQAVAVFESKVAQKTSVKIVAPVLSSSDFQRQFFSTLKSAGRRTCGPSAPMAS